MADLQSKKTEKANIVMLKGRLDIAGVQNIELQFAEIGRKLEHMIIDLSEVEFCASFGMRMLLSAAKKLDAAEKKIILVAPNESVASALEIAGLATIMPICQNETEAFNYL